MHGTIFNRIPYLVIFLTLIGSACTMPRQNTAVQNYSPESFLETLLILDSSQSMPLPQGYFGYNGDLCASPISYKNPRFRKSAKDLAPSSIIFPGSIKSNYWDWKTGLTVDQWLTNYSTDPNTASKPQGIAGHISRFNLMKGGTQFRDFLEFCKELNATPICTPNLIGQNASESLSWYDASLILGQPVRQWEMGRKLWRPEYRSEIPNVQEYIRRASAHAGAIRSALPQSQIAVNIPLRGLLRTENDNSSEGQFYRDWIDGLAKENFYSAVALNMKYTLPDSILNKPAQEIQYEMAQLLDNSITPIFNQCQTFFPDSDVWLTEMSVGMENSEQ